MVAKKKLRKITQEEFNKIASKHLSFLAGDKKSRADFSYCDLSGIDIRNVDLSGANFQWADLLNIAKRGHPFEAKSMEWLVIENANFRDSILPKIPFEEAEIEGVILIWAYFDQKQFTPEQKKAIILTEEQLKIKEQAWTIKKQEKVLEQVWEERTKELQEGFLALKEIFSNEERRWLVISITIFIVLIISALMPIGIYIWLVWTEKIIFSFMVLIVLLIYAFMVASDSEYKTEDSFFGKIGKIVQKYKIIKIILTLIYGWLFIYLITRIDFKNWWNIDYKLFLPFLPFEIISLSFLYFCVYQFSKAKNLRIEQQNKIAIISWYQALLAQEKLTWKEVRMSYFLPNISDVLFTKAFSKWEKETNLPVDEIIKIAEIVSKKN